MSETQQPPPRTVLLQKSTGVSEWASGQNPKNLPIQRTHRDARERGVKCQSWTVQPAHVCHASSDTLPTPLAARGMIDWGVDYASPSQVVGRQRGAYHQIAASAKVWGHRFWRRCVWTNITGIIRRCRDVNHHHVCLVVIAPPPFFFLLAAVSPSCILYH